MVLSFKGRFLPVINHNVNSERDASFKAQSKKSMKQQMDIPTAEELVKINEGMRQSMKEGKRVKMAGSSKGPSASKIFVLALFGGVALGLFQQYSFSGVGPPKANPIEFSGNSKIKEEVTIIRRRTDSSS